jgi:23S rRNA pseudouridine1911/1915/1917 synthase
MPISKLKILYEDNHLLAVAKPAGLATMGAAKGKATLLTMAKDYLKRRYNKPGQVYLGVVSRLDAPVTGVVLFARTSKAAARLTEQFRTQAVGKTYWALVEGILRPATGTLEDYLGKDEENRRMRIVGAVLPGARQAILTYRILKKMQQCCLVEISPETGRKHQIRLQFADHGHAVLGDKKYGSKQRFPAGIALHARRLAIRHPVKAEQLVIEAPLPLVWRHWGIGESY